MAELEPSACCYRPRRSYLVLGGGCSLFFIGMAIFSVCVSLNNTDGSLRHPQWAALILGTFWGCWTCLGLSLIAAALREQLWVAPGSIRFRGIWRTRELAIADLVGIRWRALPRGGRIVFHTDKERVCVHLNNYEPAEQRELVAFSRRLLPESKQDGWAKFVVFRDPQARPRPKPSRLIAACCALLLFGFATSFIYCWAVGLGKHLLFIGLLVVISGLHYLWRVARFHRHGGAFWPSHKTAGNTSASGAGFSEHGDLSRLP